MRTFIRALASAVCLQFLPLQAAVFVVTTTVDSGPGSMRQAILDSNATSTRNEVHFDIAPGGVQIISPLSALPIITTPVEILGSTQPGYVSMPLIQLDGLLAGPANGLWLQSSNCFIQALSITRFQLELFHTEYGHGIQCGGFGNHVIVANFIGVNTTGSGAGYGNDLNGIWLNQSDNNLIGGTDPSDRNVIADNSSASLSGSGLAIIGNTNVVQGNFIGTDASGHSALGNVGAAGVLIAGDYNLIGGSVPGAGNIISANRTNAGIELDPHLPSTSFRNVIQGNLIGTDVTGSVALPNFLDGILINAASGTQIGGLAPSERNVISGNIQDGIAIIYSGMSMGVDSTNNTIQGNFIGLDLTGTAHLGNGRDGIFVDNDLSPLVPNQTETGGSTPGQGNLIAANGRNGVTISQGISYPILGNSILDNTALGIDLGADGPTPNHPCDTVAGPNNWQNFPVLTTAVSDGSHLAVSGHLNSVPNRTCRLELFWNTHCSTGGRGDGTFLIAFPVTTDASCNADFSVSFPAAVPAFNYLAATATSPFKDTSEFSPCLKIDAPPSLSGAASSGGELVLSWSAALTNWTLQTSANLNPPKWQDDLSQVFVVNGQNTVKEFPAANTFYRLRSP